MKLPLKDIRWRIIIALGFILASVIFAIILGFLGGLVSLLDAGSNFLSDFYNYSVICYFWFFAEVAVAGILVLITTLPLELTIGFGAGLYYGTIFLASCLRDFIHTSDANLYTISCLIASLICYIVWLKSFKSRYVNEDE